MKYPLFIIGTLLLVTSFFIPELDEENNLKPSVILFDGECCMCNGFIKFIIDRDTNHTLFNFSSLQSQHGKDLLKQHNLPDDLSTVVLVDSNGKIYTKSTAILRIVTRLGKPWSFAHVFTVIPAPIRDWIYMTFTPYRYKLFGKTDACGGLASDVKHRMEA